MRKKIGWMLIPWLMFLPTVAAQDTGQTQCYNENGIAIPCQTEESPLFGQDANYQGASPAYADQRDGTVTDLNTGLMWQKTPGEPMDWNTASTSTFELAGYDDWRLPTITELYSLMLFNDTYLDTAYFDQPAAYWSNTLGLAVNFETGEISFLARNRTALVRYVRGETTPSTFADNGDGTLTDLHTGLIWLQDDSGIIGAGSHGDGTLGWVEALGWCENLNEAGSEDWRLPDAKELQSIVDYSRSMLATGSATLNPLFDATPAINLATDTISFPAYWSSTSAGSAAISVNFADGTQSRTPKLGLGLYARCVRGGDYEIFVGGEGDPSAAQVISAQTPPATPGGQQPNNTQPGGQGQPPAPPQQAIDICANSSDGDVCEFTTPNGIVTGTCRQTPNAFACVPNNR